MKRLVLPALLTVCTACTTLHPIEGSPMELRQRIDSGELLKAGDRVLIVTTDATAHKFKIVSINAGLIKGRTQTVPIEQVVKVKQRQFSRAKTTALVLGIALAGTVVGLGVYAATHLSTGAL
jgi:hypothetical protein